MEVPWSNLFQTSNRAAFEAYRKQTQLAFLSSTLGDAAVPMAIVQRLLAASIFQLFFCRLLKKPSSFL